MAAPSAEVAGTATVVGTTASVPASPVDVWARALGGDYKRRPYELQLRRRPDAHAVQAALVRTSDGQFDVEATEAQRYE